MTDDGELMTEDKRTDDGERNNRPGGLGAGKPGCNTMTTVTEAGDLRSEVRGLKTDD